MAKIATHIDDRNANYADAERVKSERTAAHEKARSEIETPLSNRVSKMDTGIGKEMLKMPALYGDAAYNVGKAIKNKLTK
jgi:hypothetical protein